MLKNKKLLGILLSIIMVLIFSIGGYASYYKYTQEGGANFYVGTGDKSDALEDTNQVRQILDDLGNLLGHSKRNDLYPKDGTTGGSLSTFNNYYLKTAIDSQSEVETIWGVSLANDGDSYLKTEMDSESELEGILSDVNDILTNNDLTNIVYCNDYDHPDDAITAIGANNKTLLVTEAETCDTNFTVPANVTVRFERGGKWTINGEYFGSTTFTGTGLNDATIGGTYTGTADLNYKIEIDGTGTPDTFKWSDDGGATWDATLVAIDGTAQNLNNGITVTFGATTGHTLADYWTVTAYHAIIVTFNGSIQAGLWQIFEYVGTGTLAGTPNIKEFNPKWFGALGDGSNDDTTAITNTIAALPTNGGVIYFPYGTYKITSTITINKRCKIYGAVKTEDHTAPIPVTIMKTGDFTGILITSNSVMLEGLNIEGAAGNGGMGIHIKGSRCVLEHVSVSKHGGIGIRIGDDSESVNCNAWRFNNVSAKYNTSHGVLIDDVTPTDTNGGSTNGLVCDYNGGDGLRVARAVVNNFHSLMTQSNTGAGLRVTTGAQYNSFWNPHSEGNTGDQFVFDAGVSHNSLIGSFVTDPVDNGNNMIMNGKSGQWKMYPQIYAPSIVTAAGASLEDAEQIRFNRNTDTSRYNSIYSKSATAGDATISFLVHDGVTATSQKRLLELFGNGIFSVPCGQLKFPATQLPSANANTLDDYEEGEWTIGISFGGAAVGVTSSQNTGYYTKIGNIVTISGQLILTSKGTSVGDALITGLPLTVANAVAGRAAVALHLTNITFANQFQGYANYNTTTIALDEITEAGVVTTLTNANFADTSRIIVNCTYRVN